MKIIVDAFGGDNAPLEILKGCAAAVAEYGVEIMLCGNESVIRTVCDAHEIALTNMHIIDVPDIISMHDDPTDVIKEKKNSSLAEGFRRLYDGEGDAYVSAGNTGAVLVGATTIVKRIKGIKRCALAPVIPSDQGAYMLIDCGANVECRPEMLAQFGLMGSVYMEKVLGVSNPRVGLANVGVEDTKGTPLQLDAYALLGQSNLNFIGNVEARDIPLGACDVLVTDGFTGNIILKLTEGMATFIMKNIKAVLVKNKRSKLASSMLTSGLKELKKRMDTDEHGGAPLLGIQKPVFKAHGSSNAKAFQSAIRQAMAFVDAGVIDIIAQNIDSEKQAE